MIDWLNDNAAAVQALSSIAIVVLTVSLVGVTLIYVILTKRLVQREESRDRTLSAQMAVSVAQLARSIAIKVRYEARKKVPLGSSGSPDGWNWEGRFGELIKMAHSVDLTVGKLAARIRDNAREAHEAFGRAENNPDRREEFTNLAVEVLIDLASSLSDLARMADEISRTGPGTFTVDPSE